MANKRQPEERTGTLPVLLFLTCFAACQAHDAAAQSKYYVSYLRPDGKTLFHILPQTLFTNPATGTDFTMDVTCPGGNDSATINFTYSHPEEISPESITLQGAEWTCQAPVKRLYINANRKLWVYRYTFAVPFSCLERFYRTDAPELTLTTASGPVRIRTSEKKWKKFSSVSGNIIRVIRANR